MTRRVLVTEAGEFLGPGVVPRFRAEGEDVVALEEPLRSREEAHAVVAEHGPFDVVVANLEVPITVAPAAEHDDATLRQLFERLVHPLFWLVDACVPAMRDAGGGAIVVPTSATALRAAGNPITGYQTARAAQVAFVEGVARELAPDGIRVNGIAPNYIENPSYFPPETVADPDFRAAVRRDVPARRLGRPEEAAAAVWWLASPEASYVHGAIIPTDGGWRLG
ncbi:SDR family oxidoreductase [Nocardioides panacisoli]|uniref:SDR family NAD(P)-dependent oxidoreductase n=1 Tax=Nocardioides panacisoli TaxID=627624 RepID=UPI001C636397|nr:SDR family oxidoreductase [Nocardioides panacisoli]QYJ04253.1 SDR family oxidoreductase [Nocardioides panacisoli]